jgi:serine protease Do
LEIARCPRGGSAVEVLSMTDPIHAMLAALGGPPSGVLVASVTRGGGAAAAGMLRGDLITHVASKEIRTVDQLRAVVSAIAPGTSVEVGLWRITEDGGRPMTITATLSDQAESRPR